MYMIIPITTANPKNDNIIFIIILVYGPALFTPFDPDNEYSVKIKRIIPMTKNPPNARLLYVVKNSKLFL